MQLHSQLQALGCLVRSLYSVARYSLFVFEERVERAESRNEIAYNLELWFEILLLTIEFVHHAHMLVGIRLRMHKN